MRQMMFERYNAEQKQSHFKVYFVPFREFSNVHMTSCPF